MCKNNNGPLYNGIFHFPKKKTSPVGGDGKSACWEVLLLGFTNIKFCSLRARFKQEIFDQFQGKSIIINMEIVQ